MLLEIAEGVRALVLQRVEEALPAIDCSQADPAGETGVAESEADDDCAP